MLCRYLHTIEWAASFVLLCVFVSVCCLTDLFCFFPMLRGWRWAFKNLYLALNANNHLEIQEPFLPDFRNCNFLPSVRFLRYCFFCSSRWFSQGTADTTRAGPCCRYWFCFSFQAYLETQVNNFPTFYLIKEGGGGVKFLDKWKMGQ